MNRKVLLPPINNSGCKMSGGKSFLGSSAGLITCLVAAGRGVYLLDLAPVALAVP